MAFAGDLYFVQFEATPRQDRPGSEEVAGAVVNCWLYASNSEAAIAQARRSIQIDRWIVGDPDEIEVVDLATFEPSDDVRPMLEQVQLDGEVYVFHCYPVDESEEE